MLPGLIEEQNGFSPRNGEAILKVILPVQNQHLHCFSPHNGE